MRKNLKGKVQKEKKVKYRLFNKIELLKKHLNENPKSDNKGIK